MKTKAKQYARALFLELKEKNKEESLLVVENFFSILKTDNNLSQIEKIISYFSVFWNKEYSLVEAEISTARLVDKNLEEEIIRYLKKIAQAEKIKISAKENKKILGGFVLKYRDKIVDASVKNRINTFKNNLLN